MIKRVLALMLALMMLAGCGASEPASSKEPVKIEIGPAEEYSPTVVDEVVKEGVFQFKPLNGSNFTMDYEPRQGSYVVNHFGLDFVFPCDTNWLGDEGNQAKFDLNEKGTDVYGSVTITTFPKNYEEYYGTSDKDAVQKKLEEEFVTVADYYAESRNAVEAAGYELVKVGVGDAFPGTDIWRAFYLEYIDTDKGNCSMHLYLCNDEINEKFYSMEIKADIPKDETERIDMFRSIIFSLKAINAENHVIGGIIGQ